MSDWAVLSPCFLRHHKHAPWVESCRESTLFVYYSTLLCFVDHLFSFPAPSFAYFEVHMTSHVLADHPILAWPPVPVPLSLSFDLTWVGVCVTWIRIPILNGRQ